MKHGYRWLLPVLLIAVLLAGCADSGDISGQITPVQTQASAEETAEQTAPAETQSPTVETEPVQPQPEENVSLGRIEGGVYTNAYAGFACVLDSSWQYYTAQELQQLPENMDALLEGTELGDATEGITQIQDMMAENVDELTSMNVVYTKIGMQERLAYAALTEEEIVDSILAESDMMLEVYTQAGIQVSAMEKVQVTFLGETHYAMKTTAMIQNVPYYTLQLFDYHAGRYGITMTLSSFVEDKTDGMLALFYKVG